MERNLVDEIAATLHTADRRGVLEESCAEFVGPLVELIKQARAEVLAACAKVTCFRCAEGNKPCDNGTTWLHFLEKKVGNVTESWNEECEAAPIRSLQPAAKDLEELLREAEVKGIRWAEGRDIAQITARLNELEKARAILEKG